MLILISLLSVPKQIFCIDQAERAAAAATGIHPLQSHVRRRLPSMNAAPAADSQQFHFNHNYYFPMLL